MVPATEVWHGNRFAHCGACGQQWALREELWRPGMQCPSCGTVVIENALIGHYQAVRRIDAGGLGEVIEAIDSVTGRSVAIKTLRHVLFQNPAFVAQFAREATIIGNLAHPNIAEVYEFFEDRGIHILAMEFLDHGSLLSRVRNGGPVPERDLLRIAMDVVRGLTAALANGVLHRDIKPANILFDAYGRAKLVDFGLALPVSEALAATGGNWGSPYYVPPERIEGQPEDFRADIYSLGVTLFHAAAGRTPFQATSASAMAWKHLKAQHVSVRTFARHISEPTTALINRCMERRPEDRFQSYFDLLEAVESAEKELLFRPPQKPSPAPDLIGAKTESSWTLRWITVAAATVLLAGTGLFLAGRSAKPDPLEGTTEMPDAYAKTAVTLAEPFPGSGNVLVDDFETGVVGVAPECWRFLPGDPMEAQGSLEVATRSPVQGCVARLHYDLTSGGNYVAAIKTFSQPIPATVVELDYMVLDDVSPRLRVVDSTGQNFQYVLPAPSSGGTWTSARVELDKIKDHWGGAGDGRFHGDLKSIAVLADPIHDNVVPGHMDFDNVVLRHGTVPLIE